MSPQVGGSMDVLSEYMKILGSIQPHVLEPGREEMKEDVLSLLRLGRDLYADEERKDGLREFRDLLQKVVEKRDSFTVIWTDAKGDEQTEYPLQIRFHWTRMCRSGPDEPHNPEPVDILKHYLDSCNLSLGTQKPKRHPRRTLIENTLTLWERYTSQPIPPKSTISSKRERKEKVLPYRLCRLVLTAIEGKDPRDFSQIYDQIAQTFQR